MRTDEKLEAFAERVETEQRARYARDYPTIEPEIVTRDCRVVIKDGARWTRVDVGTSGKFMVDRDGAIYGIKGYGKVHPKKRYGTLDTIDEWEWGGYEPLPKIKGGTSGYVAESRPYTPPAPRVAGAEEVAKTVRPLMDESKETFVALDLNARHQLIAARVVSLGSLSASIVHPREVFRDAIANGAAAIIVAHNHPSGDTEPSRDDVEITRRLIRGGHMLGIPVLDHVIVAGEGWLSLRREGMIAWDPTSHAGLG